MRPVRGESWRSGVRTRVSARGADADEFEQSGCAFEVVEVMTRFRLHCFQILFALIVANGARALARFNVRATARFGVTWTRLSVCTLKRRKRRAPSLLSCVTS